MILRPLGLMLVILGLAAAGEAGAWKTAYIKRGWVGMFEAGWAAGIGGTQRMRTPLAYGGSKVRVQVCGGYEDAVDLVALALVKGADEQGRTAGDVHPILFAGKPTLHLDKGFKQADSDEIAVALSAGTWYLQDRYGSAKFPYAYDVDRGYCAPGDALTQPTMEKQLTCRTGLVRRIDVFTTDPRNSILCYGDSITHGYGSTPNSGRRFPELLGGLINRPVLNLGQNGDLASQGAGMAMTTRDLLGVDTVIFLMGINDIIGGSTSLKAYSAGVHGVIQGCQAQKRRIFIGTIPPAAGYPAFDAKPEKEALRLELNAWIRQGNGADGVIDFAAALADPANPARMAADLQSDWLHPGDLGYQRMAEAAAKGLGHGRP